MRSLYMYSPTIDIDIGSSLELTYGLRYLKSTYEMFADEEYTVWARIGRFVAVQFENVEFVYHLVFYVVLVSALGLPNLLAHFW